MDTKLSFEIVVTYAQADLHEGIMTNKMVFNTDNYNQAKKYMQYLQLSDVISVTINKHTLDIEKE